MSTVLNIQNCYINQYVYAPSTHSASNKSSAFFRTIVDIWLIKPKTSDLRNTSHHNTLAI
jgi:hypothetical protein